MKIGNVKKLLIEISERYKIVVSGKDEYSECLEHSIKDLPLKHLEQYFQEKFNKSMDYDQWVGIREELRTMGYKLYCKTIAIIGDSLVVMNAKDQEKIEKLEVEVRDLKKEKESLEKALKKVLD